jgi:hypothetical protein
MDKEQFKKELKELLQKYNAHIAFEVGEGSDTFGLYGERIVVYCDDSKQIAVVSNGWDLSTGDL